MSIGLTKKQIKDLNVNGFTIIEKLLDKKSLMEVSEAMDFVADEILKNLKKNPGYLDGQFYGDGVKLRNCITSHKKILDLIDHPKILPLVVNVLGWNIQNRDSVFDYKVPNSNKSDAKKMSHGWHFDYEEEFSGTTLDGRMPLLDFKIGWYISDHTESGHSTILLVPGSFKWDKMQRATWESWLDPKNIFELRVPAGSVMLWRPTLLHGVTPNLSNSIRKAIYISYCPRWIRPSSFLQQDKQLIASSNPIRRQLLGAMGDLSDPLGKEPKNSPSSQYWFSDNWGNVPLKAWAEKNHCLKRNDLGLGFGISEVKGPDYKFKQRTLPEHL
jgi:ectoine hydroxylase-related dioxygenase (phytanoyl-CoA dioxygenase family)